MKVLIEYSFIIDPSLGWQNIQDFEKLFSEFLSTRGLVARRITTEDDREMFEIEGLPNQVTEPEPEQTIKQIKAQLTSRRDSKGKFIK